MIGTITVAADGAERKFSLIARSRDKRSTRDLHNACSACSVELVPFGRHKRTGVRPFKFAKCILYLPTTKFLKRPSPHLFIADPRWRMLSTMSTTEKLHRSRPQRLPRLQLYLGKILRLPHLRHRRLLRIRAASCSFIASASLAKCVVQSFKLASVSNKFCSGRLCTGLRSERCSRQSFSL